MDGDSRNYFWDVVRKTIQFQKAVFRMEKAHECIYIDLGPSGILADFAKNNLARTLGPQCYSIMTPFNQELQNFRKIKALFGRDILNI
jgi:DNA-binding MurR/RpiR family transcriptional regulator